MKNFFKILLVILSIAVGATFLYSAYTKVIPIQNFEYTIVEFTHLAWPLAAVLARFFVGFEAAIGALLILHIYGKNKWVLKSALALLTLFSIYLIYLWATQGNNVNCGCFGDEIWMSPAASLIKNALLIAVIMLLLRFHNGFNFKLIELVSLLAFFVVVTTVYIVYPIPGKEPDWLLGKHYKLNLSALYAPGKADAPKVDLYKGKHIVTFFSLGCPHCRMTALKMHLMKENNPALPFHMVLTGDSVQNFKAFFEKTKAQNIPYTMLQEDTFKHIIERKVDGGYSISVPEIDWLQNGWVEAQAMYITLDQGEIEKWLKK